MSISVAIQPALEHGEREKRLIKTMSILVEGEIVVRRFRNVNHGPYLSVEVVHTPTGWNVSSQIHKEYIDNLIIACAFLYAAITGMVGQFDDRWDGLLRVRQK